MGFFDSLSKLVVDSMFSDEGQNYREIYFANAPSNNGWYKCEHCKKSFRKCDIDVDHIVPKSKGGTNSYSNLQGLCRHCNRSKKDNMTDTLSDLTKKGKERAKIEKETRDFEKYLKKHK